MRAMRFVLGGAGAVLTGLGIGLALAIVAPLAFHGRPYTVMSGSMEPAIGTGDVVVSTRISPMSARPGEVVTFRDPEGSGRLITHRVRSLRRAGGKAVFTTRGDANNTTEHWRVPVGGEISRVRYRIPEVGRAAVAMRGRGGVVLVLVVPLLAFGAVELARIWRPREEVQGEVAA